MAYQNNTSNNNGGHSGKPRVGGNGNYHSLPPVGNVQNSGIDTSKVGQKIVGKPIDKQQLVSLNFRDQRNDAAVGSGQPNKKLPVMPSQQQQMQMNKIMQIYGAGGGQ